MTGYTSILVEDDLDFRGWVLTCARAMGACVMMRDDPIDKLPPERFEPSTYYKDVGEKAAAELVRLRGLDDAGIVTEAEKRLGERKRYRDECQEKNSNNIQVMRAMLERTRAWEPPTPDHHGLKKLMVEQLERSVRVEGVSDYHTKEAAKDAVESPESVVAGLIADAERTIESSKAHYREEIERTEMRNKWLADLRASL